MLRHAAARMCHTAVTAAAAAADKAAFMQLVKTLRFRTEAPISECTAALREAQLDMDAAVAVLQRRGVARAQRRGHRVTGHGFVVRCIAPAHAAAAAAIVTLCSETDFAARSDTFQSTCLRVRDAMCGLLEQQQQQQQPQQSGDRAAQLTQMLSEACAPALQSAMSVLGEHVRVGGVHLLQPAPQHVHVDGDGTTRAAAPLRIGSYVHGGVVADNGVGRYVGLVAVRPLDTPHGSAHDTTTAAVAADVDEATLTALARHFVATCGADEDDDAHAAGDDGDGGTQGKASDRYAAAEFFGSATADARETVAQWLQRHRLQFSSSIVVEFGKEPVVHTATSSPPQQS